MFKLKCIFLLVVFCLSVSNVYAEYKVAIVDLNRVVNSTTEAKIKREELEKLSDAAKKDYEKRAEKVKKLEQEYIKTNDKNKGLELEKASRDLRLFADDSKSSLQKKFKDTNEILIKKVVDVIREYAEDNDIDLVLDKNSLVLGVVVYNENAIDVTEDLIRKVK